MTTTKYEDKKEWEIIALYIWALAFIIFLIIGLMFFMPEKKQITEVDINQDNKVFICKEQ